MTFNLKFNLATLEIGSWISTFLFGILTSQAYSYYNRYFRRDKQYLNVMVAVVWLCELAHTCSTASGFFTVSIIHFNEPAKIFSKSPVGYVISTFMSAVVASIVQVHFALQVLKLVKKRYIAYTCWFLSLLRFMGSVAMTVVLATKSLSEFQGSWIAAATWATGAVVDVVIAVTLTLFYVKCRKEAIRNKRILDHLIPMTMQTGLLTSMSTVAIAIAFIALPHTLVWGAIGSALAKIFSISLLTSLNSRSFFRELVDSSNPRLRPSDLILKFRNSPTSPTLDSISELLETGDTGNTTYHSFPGESTYQLRSDNGQQDLLFVKTQGDPPTLVPFLPKKREFQAGREIV